MVYHITCSTLSFFFLMTNKWTNSIIDIHFCSFLSIWLVNKKNGITINVAWEISKSVNTHRLIWINKYLESGRKESHSQLIFAPRLLLLCILSFLFPNGDDIEALWQVIFNFSDYFIYIICFFLEQAIDKYWIENDWNWKLHIYHLIMLLVHRAGEHFFVT